MSTVKEITVYSKPSCVQCNATYKALDKTAAKGEYAIINVAEDMEALDKVKNLGYMAAPVVVVTNTDGTIEHWAGFRPDRITAVTENYTVNLSVDANVLENAN